MFKSAVALAIVGFVTMSAESLRVRAPNHEGDWQTIETFTLPTMEEIQRDLFSTWIWNA